MGDFLLGIYDALESFFDSLGLMTGELAIIKRMVFGAGVATGIAWLVKPAIMFDKNTGVARPWTYFQSKDENQNNNKLEPTSFPWFVAPIIGAFVLGVLI